MSILKILASYQVVKRGSCSDKNRTLVIRSDGLFFLSTGESAELKRHIPLAAINGINLYDKNMLLHIAVRSVEHDCLLSKAGGPVDDIATILLRVAKMEKIPLDFSNEGSLIPPSGLQARLRKKPGYLTMQQRLQLRRGQVAKPIPPGPITLKAWDLVAGALPYPVDTNKMTTQFQRNFAGMYVVMLGVVNHYDGPSVARRAIIFTLARLYLCDEATGLELASCSLFAISAMSINQSLKRITLEFVDEIFKSLTFALVPAASAATATTKESHVSEDVSQVGDVIRYLINRHGFAIPGDAKSKVLPISAPLERAATEVVEATSESAALPRTASSPTRQAPEPSVNNIPDYKAPFGPIAQQFLLPTTLLARPVMRFTSKAAWEPRVLVITAMKLLVICDDKTNVKRTIPISEILNVVVYSHIDGPVMALAVNKEHDLVFRHRADAPPLFTLTHIITVLRSLLDGKQLECTKESVSKDALKQTLRKRNLVKPATFVPPAEQAQARLQTLAVAPTQETRSSSPPSSAQLQDAGSSQSLLAVDLSAQRAARPMSPMSEDAFSADRSRAFATASPEPAAPSGASRSVAASNSAVFAPVSAPAPVTQDQSNSALFTSQPSTAATTSAVFVPPSATALDQQSRPASPQKPPVVSAANSVVFAPPSATTPSQDPQLGQLPATSAVFVSPSPVVPTASAVFAPSTNSQSRRISPEEPSLTAGNSATFASPSPYPPLQAQSSRTAAVGIPISLVEQTSLRQGEAMQPIPQQAPQRPAEVEMDAFIAIQRRQAARGDSSRETADGQTENAAPVLRQPTVDGASALRNVELARVHAQEEAERRRQADEAEQRRSDAAARRMKEDAEWERRFGVKAAEDPASPRPMPRLDDKSFHPSRNQIPFPTAQSLKVAARGDDGIRNYFFRVKMSDNDTFTLVGTEPLLHSLLEKFGRKGKDPLEVPSNERVVMLCTEEGRVMVGFKKALLDLLRVASLRSWIRRDVVMCRSASFTWTEMPVVPFVLGMERGESACALASARIDAALQ